MSLKLYVSSCVMGLMLLGSAVFCFAGGLEVGPADVPVKGQVTMVDIGAKKCIPCKMMAPILDKLEVEFRGRAAIRFIDVWENPGAAKPFAIGLIPTQIFYDAKGKEVFRHEGFMSEGNIKAKLAELGVE